MLIFLNTRKNLPTTLALRIRNRRVSMRFLQVHISVSERIQSKHLLYIFMLTQLIFFKQNNSMF